MRGTKEVHLRSGDFSGKGSSWPRIKEKLTNEIGPIGGDYLWWYKLDEIHEGEQIAVWKESVFDGAAYRKCKEYWKKDGLSSAFVRVYRHDINKE